MKRSSCKYFYLTISISLNLTGWLYSQTEKIAFERLSFEQGLSQGTVYTMIQDSRGFMWFGTQDGLNRYDGYNFVVYKHSHTDSHSISDNFIQYLYEDRERYLWIGTNNGLNRFDLHTEKFIHYKNDPKNNNSLSGNAVRAIYEDRAGNLWVGASNGLNRYERATGVWKRYSNDPQNTNSLSHNSIHAISGDRSHKLWIGTLGGGLNRFDPTTEKFKHFKNDPQDTNSISSNFVLSLYLDANDELWVGTYGDGLNKLDARREKFQHFRHDSTDLNSLGDDRVYAIWGDANGILWLGTSLGGLIRFDPAKKIFARFQHDPLRPKSLSANFVRSLCADRSGNLWLGTDFGGLNKLDLKPAKFLYYYHDANNPASLRHNFVNAMHTGPDGTLWIGTNWGLDKIEAESTSFQHIALKLNDIKNDRIFIAAIWIEDSGAIWLGTFGSGLLKYQPVAGGLKQFKNDPTNPASLSGNIVNCLYKSRDGTLWIGTLRGLSVLSRESEAFTVFKHDPQNPGSLSQNGISCILEDRSGSIWVGTNASGLNKFDPASQTFTRYIHDPDNPNSLSNNAITSLYEDAQGFLWVGTNYGLSRFNREDRQREPFTNYFEKNGLPNDYINGILGDEEGNLWLSTNKGISRFNPQLPTGRQFRNYNMADGLQGPSYFEGSAFKSKFGEMFFGGSRGFNRFHPRQVLDNPYSPAVAITSFKIFDKPVKLDTVIFAIKTITLSHRDNFFSFEFAAFDYSHPQKNLYAYKIEGFDEDWIQSGTRRYASYTNLDPGTYRFRVKGSNNDGIWNETGATVKIIITPPFWKTWWFRVSAVVAIVGLLTLIYRYRVSRLLEVERLRVRIASDLHDDIGATLTKISLHSELIQDSSDSSEIRDSLRKIGAMSRELITTMSDIVWSIDARNDTIGNLIDRMRDFAASVFSVKPVEVDFNCAGLDLQKKLPVDLRQNIYLIFKEAINNIAKHAEAARVDVWIENINGTFSMKIRDDGKGWRENEYEKLTGHGLRNMKMRAARISGHLDISKNGGCTVSLTAPALR